MSICKTNNTTEFTTKDLLNETKREIIGEAVNYFNRKHTRKTNDDSRYFFSWDEVTAVIEGLKDKESVIISVYKDKDKVYCYIITPVIYKETRKKKARKKKNEIPKKG